MFRSIILCVCLIGCSESGISGLTAAPQVDAPMEPRPTTDPDDGTDPDDTGPATTPPTNEPDQTGTDADPATETPADPTTDEDPDSEVPDEEPTDEEPVEEDPVEEEPVEPPATAYSQTWNTPLAPPVDVLVFGDTSGSMDEELTTLGANITTFTNRLVADNVDWRLMAVNGDEGCGVDGWFDTTTTDWQNRFADALLEEPDDHDEAGLQVVADAVENTSCNAGFLRPGALLHVIFISDEADQSEGHPSLFSGSADYWMDYVSRVEAVKGSPDLVKMSAVAGPNPDGCDGADAGEGYAEAVSATGGTFVSICDAWAGQLDTIASASLQTTFTLTDLPDLSTLSVTIDGVVLPSTAWTYDAADNSVELNTAPAPGAAVVIRYDGA